MIHAYTEQYLHDAMINLGEAFDYAVNACKMKADAFMELFIASGYADKFGKGNPKVISGFSGTELVMEVCLKSGIAINFPEAQIEYAASAEYWSGWILAFYQWYTDQSFKDIHANISMIEVLKMYSTHHEAAEEKFLYTVNAILRRKKQTTKLQAQRKTCGYSQRELAEKSGVNLRTLQQYELGTKEIGKASVRAVASLANALGCRVEDLLETVAISEE
ncbi:MAG: helix-turn-helix transcriptional regulator [Emergencia sp.]|jgi:DNA-binding XRE family transcriptional regulator|nr:helix-turn-helix transcriptional regulator [Emergencia sp.]